jgi:hypothetical protein
MRRAGVRATAFLDGPTLELGGRHDEHPLSRRSCQLMARRALAGCPYEIFWWKRARQKFSVQASTAGKHAGKIAWHGCSDDPNIRADRHLDTGDISSASVYDCAMRDRGAGVHCVLN